MPTFPALSNGAITEYDYPETDVFYVAQSTPDCGIATTYAQNASAKLAFQVTYAMLTSSQLAALESFWNSVGGPLGYFTFTDDGGTTYTTCRFDQTSMSVEYYGPGQLGTTLRIRVV